jgi:hypothetical protein
MHGTRLFSRAILSSIFWAVVIALAVTLLPVPAFTQSTA